MTAFTSRRVAPRRYVLATYASVLRGCTRSTGPADDLARLRRSSLCSRCDRALLEGEPRFQRTPHWAGPGNAFEPALLLGGEIARKVQVDEEASRDALGVVVDFHRRLADLPAPVLHVHGNHRRDARGERRGEQLVRRRPAVGTAQALRLVGDDRVPAVDVDLVLEAIANAAGCRGHAHQRSLLAR